MVKNKEKDRILTDAELIGLYFARDEGAIGETDRKYRRYLCVIAGNILGDPLDTEEVLNDTYLSAWNAIPPARPAFMAGFLAQIIRRIAVNRVRSRAAAKRAASEYSVCLDDLAEILQGESSIEEEYEISRLGALISEYVRGLPERRRFVFVERYYSSAPVEKIAKELAVSIHTVYREIECIKTDLALHLERNGVCL